MSTPSHQHLRYEKRGGSAYIQLYMLPRQNLLLTAGFLQKSNSFCAVAS